MRLATLEYLREVATNCSHGAARNALRDAADALEVSEAVNRAKTELIINVKAILTAPELTPGQQVMNALNCIAARTGAPKSDVNQQGTQTK